MNSTVSAEPKFFNHKKDAEEWISVALSVLNSNFMSDNLIKNSALDFISTLLERIPTCLEKFDKEIML
jgi:hypothetical protein